MQEAQVEKTSKQIMLKAYRHEICCSLIELADIILSFYPLTDKQMEDILLRLDNIANNIRAYLAKNKEING